ncbi:GLPGLI family protein [Chryseobacterium candidae]|uniref:GLPGLI family protein n=1 Tax=Chryseobacterium candidae TaxID=1978493 RepID=A0ABY2R4C9_9FLAO|nr:GLPGLI family protein [Chryseobacterium candidae]THV57537.1 GLPGLI family protein [Chryseobacterium candidae]
MKYYLILFVIIYPNLFSQIKFNVDYEADYELNYRDMNTPNALVAKTTFALLLNKNESFFKNMNKYILDSLVYEKKISYSGNAYQDMKVTEKYYSDFPETIGTTSAKMYISLPIYNKNFRYEEPNAINWQLFNEFKTIGKYKCQKAIAKKYGRTWIAWFAKEIPFPFGPYKFSGLPGLILEVSDERKDYVYTMYSFRKRKYTCNSANMYKDSKLVDKKKVFDFKRKSMQDVNKFKQIIDDPEIIKIVTKEAPKMAKSYNPIELSIY